MKKSFKNFAKNIAETVYKVFGSDSGQMLLMTSIIGSLASCLAQTGAIILNKKYTDSQKAFMVPQELTEGFVTIASIFLITKPIQAFAKKSVKTGKLLSSDLKNYLKKNNLVDNLGDSKFDFSGKVKELMQQIKNTERYAKSTELDKEKLLQEHAKALENFDIFLDSTSAIATTIAGATSISVVSPLLRNTVAAKSQKTSLNKSNFKLENPTAKNDVKPICSNLLKYNQNVCKI